MIRFTLVDCEEDTKSETGCTPSSEAIEIIKGIEVMVLMNNQRFDPNEYERETPVVSESIIKWFEVPTHNL